MNVNSGSDDDDDDVDDDGDDDDDEQANGTEAENGILIQTKTNDGLSMLSGILT